METVSGLVAELKIHVEKIDESTGKSEVQSKESLSPNIFFGCLWISVEPIRRFRKKNHWSNQLVIREEDLLAKSRQQCYHPIEMA